MKKKLAREETKQKSVVKLLDTNELISGNIKGENTDSMVIIIFERIWQEDKDENLKRRWKHKGIKSRFWQYCSLNNKSWDTGIWDK